jgi:transposase
MQLGACQILVAIEPVDMRLGLDGLSRIVQDTLGQNVGNQCGYLFSNRTRTRLKLLRWDGNGVWLCQRRLHKGRFTWPEDDAQFFVLTAEQWHWLISGVDWQRLYAQAKVNWRV